MFKPGPTTMQISLYDGTNLLETTEQGTPGSNTEIKVLLNEGDLNVWLGDISSPSPSWVASGLPIRVGNYGFINGTPSGGDNWGTHTVTSFYSAMDSAFNVQITDPIPGELSFVSSTEGENIDGVVTFPLLPGPVLAGAEISYEWTAEIVSCPSDLLKIENIAYTNIFGIEENSIAAQAILDCSGLDLCGDAPEVPLLTDGDEVLICSGDVTGINAEDYVETTSADFELIWFDGPSKFDNEIDAPVVDGDEVGEKVYYVAQIADVVCGEGDRIAITFVVGDGAEGVTEEITIESGESVGFDVASELGYEVGNIQWTASESLNIEGESTTTITDDTITDVLINTSGTDQIVEYSIEELSSSDCGKGISTLIVTVTSALCDIVVPEVINADYCLSQEVTETLDFYIEAEGTITWYADNEETSAAITMPSVDTSLSGETIYYVSQVIDDCESERVEFKVTVQEIKSAFNDEITIDSGDTLNYDLLALGLIDQAVSWSAINNENITGETLTSINGNTIIDTLVNTSDVDQVVIYTIIETTTDGCQRENSTITVTITAPLCLTEAPEVESVEYCLNEVITDTIDSYVTADGTVLWYADNELTSTAITMPTIDTSLSGEITYYVSQVIDGCESERVEILVKENEGNSGVIQHTEVILSNESLLFDIPIETGLIAGSFEWSASVDSNITGNTISISNEIVITDTLINDSNFDRQIEYTITPFDCNEAIHVLTVTIRTLPSVELNTSAVVEGDDLQVELIFSKPTVSETTIVIGINPGTVNGVSADDISLEDVTIVIPAGVEDFSFAIPTIDDDLSEPSENLEISIKSVEPENLTNFSEIVEVAIIDNDGLPSILIDDIEILEGETKAVNIRLSNPSSEDITITVSLVFTNDTTTDRDFELLDQDSITVSFLAGETEPITQTNIRAIDDSIPEGDQVLIVSVATVDNGVLNDSTDTAEITIIDDDLAPTIIIDDAQVNEGDTIEIPIYLRSPALDRIELLVSFRDDDTDGDFDATRQLVVFEAGSRVPNTPLEVEIFQDSIPENDEDFIAFIAIGDIIQGTVNFGGFIGLDSGIITIQDDDVDVDIILSEVVLEEGETKEIPISLSDPSTEDITITLLIENGTTTDTDYVVSSVEVTFLAGSTLPDSPVTILATDDILEEDDELLVVSVFSVNTGTINDSSDTAQIIIENKDGSEEEEVPLPECVVITNPIPGATNISLSPRITWEEDVNATAYFISVGTSPNGTDIVATQNVGDNTTYFIPFDLENDTDYYISITPNNADGLSPIDSCASEIFRTKEAIEVSKTKYGLSPDGDGINEFWMIDDIENYPNNEVLIYNRWGNLVFRTINYDNNFNVFSGIANQQTNLGAGDLLSGTYFYEIKIDGEHDFTNLKGFLVLKR